MVKNNEKGSTLVMVLLIVAVITILGASLFSMNMSASKQFTNKEHQVQARHLAEMGVMHYQAAIAEVVLNYNQKEPIEYFKGSGKDRVLDEEKTRQMHTKGLCKEFIKLAEPSYSNSLNHNYEVVKNKKENQGSKKSGLNVTLGCDEIDYTTNEMFVAVNSKGTVDETTKEIKANIEIGPLESKPEEDEKPDPDQNEHEKHLPSKDDVEVFNGNFKIPEGGYAPEKSNFHIKGNLDADNGNKNTNLTVEKNLYIDGDIVMNNHSCIVVKGDLTVKGEMPKNFNAHIYLIVYGDAFFGKAPDKINSGGIYVKGTVTGNNLGHLSSYKTPIDNCDIIDSPSDSSDFKWKVNPDVNPEYFQQPN